MTTLLFNHLNIGDLIMTINKEGDIVSLKMKERELDALYSVIGSNKALEGACKVIEEFYNTYSS